MVRESEARNVGIRRSFPLSVLLLFLAASPLLAVDPNRHISQYAHTAWRIQDGVFKGAPWAIAQTIDGYIWIGTKSGLLRFDGVRFVPWASPDGTQLASPEVYALLGARDGSLWIGTRAGLSHWTNGRMVNYVTAKGGVITSILEDHDGTVWFTHLAALDGSGTLCHVMTGGIHCYGSADGIPMLGFAVELDPNSQGNYWIGGDTAFVRWKPGSSTVYRPRALQSHTDMPGAIGFAFDTDGSIWAGVDASGSDGGLQHFVKGMWKPFVALGLDGASLEVHSLFMDSHHALWVGTTNQGIYRIFAGEVDHFQFADGLSNNRVANFHEDREGSIWVATSKGLDKFSDLQVASYSTREGLGSEEIDSVIAARDGTLWVAGEDSLDALRDAKVLSLHPGKGLPGNQVTSLLEDHRGRMWVGIDNGLTIYEKGKFRRIDKPDGSSFGVIVDMAEDINNDVWLETGEPSRSLIRIHNDKVQEQFPAPQMVAARQLAADPAGGLWLGTLKGDLAHYQNGNAEVHAFKHNPDSWVDQLLVNPDGSVLGATAFGLIALKQGVQQTMTVKNGLPCDSILTTIQDNSGTLWLLTRCGLVEVASDELRKWWDQPDSVLKLRVFDEFDGVQPGWAPFQKAARTPNGRLWFVNGTVLQMIDPQHLYENTLPPPVYVENITADQRIYSPSQDVRLPALTHELEIDYTALSFMVPQKVRFRYKLDGQDAGWQDPGTRRQAFYNDLGPGTYSFHVLACNNDGVWNEIGASLQFTVTPAWYQTFWFRVLAALFGILLVWSIYQFRVRQIAAALAARFDERLGERTRLARELHDTFLQTVQGSKMVADDALDPTSDETRMRKALAKLSAWLAQAVDEGRAALHSLRVSTIERNQLSESLRRATEDPQFPASMTVTFSVIGDAIDLHPVVRDDVYRVAFEAIRNAAMHSHASVLEIDLRYADTLTLRIKDNGVGIDPSISNQGKAGHFGLQGMRERAARIHSKLTIVSSTNAGTEVTLVVPGKVVYRKAHATLWARIRAEFLRLFSRSTFVDK